MCIWNKMWFGLRAVGRFAKEETDRRFGRFTSFYNTMVLILILIGEKSSVSVQNERPVLIWLGFASK